MGILIQYFFIKYVLLIIGLNILINLKIKMKWMLYISAIVLIFLIVYPAFDSYSYKTSYVFLSGIVGILMGPIINGIFGILVGKKLL